MGTNFYTEINDIHIGKRSAAGLFCWDCKITLCKGQVHSGAPFRKSCPKCGKRYVKEPLEFSAAGRELGFNKQEFNAKTGVKGASSFSWAIRPETLLDVVIANGGGIIDEYGRTYTLEKFGEMLQECPIRLTHSIGQEFS